MAIATTPKALSVEEGLRLQSGPGRDLIFKVTGDDTNNAFDFFTVEVDAGNGPPLHVHHTRDEAIYVIRGRFKVVVGDETFTCEAGGFAYMPATLPHSFLNLGDEMGEIIIIYTPGGGHRFYEEFGPAARSSASREVLAGLFAKHDMELLGPPLTAG